MLMFDLLHAFAAVEDTIRQTTTYYLIIQIQIKPKRQNTIAVLYTMHRFIPTVNHPCNNCKIYVKNMQSHYSITTGCPKIPVLQEYCYIFQLKITNFKK